MNTRIITVSLLITSILALSACGIERRHDRREDRREDRKDLVSQTTPFHNSASLVYTPVARPAA